MYMTLKDVLILLARHPLRSLVMVALCLLLLINGVFLFILDSNREALHSALDWLRMQPVPPKKPKLKLV